MNRYEFWPEKFVKEEEILEQDIEILGKTNLIVGQIYELYKLMDIDEKKELERIIVEKKEKKKANVGEGRNDKIIKKNERHKTANKKLLVY